MATDKLPLLANHPKKANGVPIQELKITSANFLNRSVAVYGKSNSGKSTVIRNIIQSLYGHVEMAFAFSAMENQNDTYKDMIPIAAIDTNIEQKHVHDFIKTFWERQNIATQIYRKATRMDILQKLYDKVCTAHDNEKHDKMKEYKRKVSDSFDRLIESKKPLERGYYNEEKKAIMSNLEQFMIEFYRRVIKKNISRIKKHKLKDDEVYCIEYIGFRPHVLLIFDDCVHTFTKKFQASAEFRDLFVAGRHNCITVILAAHLRSHLDKTVNENVARSIFCTKAIAANAAERMDSSCRDEVRDFMNCINVVYSESDEFRKLAYVSNCPDPFRWIRATKIDYEPDEDKRKYIGSKYFIRICQNAIIPGDAFDESNQFTEDFILKVKHKKK